MLDPVDEEQNHRIAWCEKLLYAIILLQFPQLAQMM